MQEPTHSTRGRSGEAPRPALEVRRSARRTRSVTAFREGGTTVVCIPASFSADQEADWVAKMTARLAAREQRSSLDDAALARRAAQLSRQYLAGAARPRSVRWVDNQQSRWGSCTPSRGTIRISHRVARLPEWVLDYVLIHELAHLLVPGHGRDFWALVAAYPLTERARGFLDGVSAAVELDLSGFDGLPDDGEPPAGN